MYLDIPCYEVLQGLSSDELLGFLQDGLVHPAKKNQIGSILTARADLSLNGLRLVAEYCRSEKLVLLSHQKMLPILIQKFNELLKGDRIRLIKFLRDNPGPPLINNHLGFILLAWDDLDHDSRGVVAEDCGGIEALVQFFEARLPEECLALE